MADDARSMVGRHELVYQTPPRIWESEFLIGSGHFRGMVWQTEDPDRIAAGVTELGVSDLRRRARGSGVHPMGTGR